MSTDTTAQPMSRRDVWLTVSLAIARDGLPAPRRLDVRDDILGVELDFEARDGAAQEWAEHIGLPRQPDVTTRDGKGLILTWWGQRDGRSWSVRAVVPRPEPPAEPTGLAAELVAAIEAAP